MIKTTLRFFATALCEIIGCFCPVVVKTKRQYLAVASGRGFTRAVCLVVNVASSGEWRVYAADRLSTSARR
ncbi:hypothetical protein ACNKHV_09820 [Shigella flexneri]